MIRYPIYVISKGRADACLTARFLVEDGVPFTLVVEPQEAELYAERYGAERLLITPFSNLGLGSIPVRNFVWEHSLELGHARHWVMDDNIRRMMRLTAGRRYPVEAGIAVEAAEEFADRYTNIGILGFMYRMFATGQVMSKPFATNTHVYSTLLIDNGLPYRWRGRYNEDTDLCLQVLSGRLCTVLLYAFLIDKMQTMTMKGGNSDELYRDDGRLMMARSLKRQWPGVADFARRYDRPQHVVPWAKFKQPLIRRDDIDFDALTAHKYRMELGER